MGQSHFEAVLQRLDGLTELLKDRAPVMPKLRLTGDRATHEVNTHGVLLCAKTGKQRFLSERRAKKARKAFFKSRGFKERHGSVLNVFHCPSCGDWHLGNLREDVQ
jgi:hypothetical protein